MQTVDVLHLWTEG